MSNDPQSTYLDIPIDFATNYLRHYFRQFPFSDWTGDGPERTSRSLAVHIAAMLSQFCALLIPRGANRMGFIYNANTQRSGKTLLIQTAIIPVHGTFKAQSWLMKDDDMRKLLDAECLGGSTYICFDNVRGMLSSQVLEAFMTASNWAGRVLGMSKNFEAPNNATIFFSGNNCNPSIDIQNRCLLVDLYVTEADPTQRKIDGAISASSISKWPARQQLLSCLWSLVRHWDTLGRPGPPDTLRPGFEEWGQVIGGIVHAAGFGNPLAVPADAGSGQSTEETDIYVLINKMVADNPDATRIEFHFQDIVDICWRENLFSWIIEDGKEEKDQQTSTSQWILKPAAASSMGKTLQRWMPVGNYRLYRDASNKPCRLTCSGRNRQRRYILER